MADHDESGARPRIGSLLSAVGGPDPALRMGQFVVPELEAEYRASRFERDRRLTRRVIIGVAGVCSVLAVNDYRFAGTSGVLWALLSLRLLATGILVVLWRRLARASRPESLDRIVTGAFLTLIALFGIVQSTRPPGLPGAVLISLGITFTVFLPTLLPTMHQLAIGATLCLVTLVSEAVMGRTPLALLTYGMVAFAANVLGTVVSFYQHGGQRLQFSALLRSGLLGRYFERLIDTSPNVIYVTDPEGHVLFANRQTRLSGIRPVTFEEVVRSGQRVERDERIVDQDGVVRWFHTVQVPFAQPDGRTHVVGISTDITERLKADEERRLLEAKVQHAQKLESLGVLAGGIAHDFNNLLAVIMGNASYAGIVASQNPEALGAIREIDRAAQRAADLVEQMLAYAGQGHFAIGALDLSAAVREMSALLRPVIGNIACRLELDEAWVTGDVSQIRQIVMNLMTNAADAIAGGGHVTLRTGARKVTAADLQAATVAEGFTPGICAMLEVQDTGVGMDAATLARIFDPFFTTKFTGRGLGLAAVLGIVRRHRGALRVTSTPGKGTTFTVWLPRAEAPSGAPPLADTPDDVLVQVAEAMARRGVPQGSPARAAGPRQRD
ncbi:MAG: ATP-binding protein [Vicinamibacterales bacterium]